MSSDSADPFYWLRVIMASNRGKGIPFSLGLNKGGPLSLQGDVYLLPPVCRYVDGAGYQPYSDVISHHAGKWGQGGGQTPLEINANLPPPPKKNNNNNNN